MGFVIDTSVLIEIEKDNKLVLERLENLHLIKDEIYITSPTYTEFYFGLLNLSKDKLVKEKQRLDSYKLLNTTKNSSVIMADIKNKLSKIGAVIPIFDLFIASISMDSRMPLVTLDGHFKKIQDLNAIII